MIFWPMFSIFLNGFQSLYWPLETKLFTSGQIIDLTLLTTELYITFLSAFLHRTNDSFFSMGFKFFAREIVIICL